MVMPMAEEGLRQMFGGLLHLIALGRGAPSSRPATELECGAGPLARGKWPPERATGHVLRRKWLPGGFAAAQCQCLPTGTSRSGMPLASLPGLLTLDSPSDVV